MTTLTIAVVGPGAAAADADLLWLAEQVGALVARAGATLVCGGLGGVMAAAARGARAAGGTAIGVLPGNDRSEADGDMTVVVATGLGEARNTVIVRTADAVIAVGGGYGTLSEIAFALKLGKPVIGLQTWELHRDGAVDDGIVAAADPEGAVRAAVAAVGAE